MNHTPGPLVVDTIGEKTPHPHYVVETKYDPDLAAPLGRVLGYTFDTSPQSLADATLWAAAPDLLEALEALYESHRVLMERGDYSPEEVQARAAIVKARGEA
jgi:hypothetical protein